MGSEECGGEGGGECETDVYWVGERGECGELCGVGGCGWFCGGEGRAGCAAVGGDCWDACRFGGGEGVVVGE